MLAIYLIGLREGLEAALIVSILIGSVVKLGRRELLARIWAGIVLAVVLTLAIGALLTYGTYGLSFQAQEAIGGGLSVVAVGFVTWMLFWMMQHARRMSSDIRADVDRSLAGSGFGIALLAFLSVAREGIETSLFIWSAAASATLPAPLSLGAAVLGILTAAAIGVLIAKGAVRIDLGQFFTVTGAFLIVVAAGVLSYGLHDLQEANLLPGLRAVAFDVSAAVPLDSWYGTFLKGVLNFSAVTTWLELGAWLTYVAGVGACFTLALRRGHDAPARLAAVPAH